MKQQNDQLPDIGCKYITYIQYTIFMVIYCYKYITVYCITLTSTTPHCLTGFELMYLSLVLNDTMLYNKIRNNAK